MSLKLSNNPIRGTSDWLPPEFAVRQYIFDTWRRVNRQFGYEEYLTPIFELADIYRAKSGEDVGGKELLVITDQAGRELAMRPEMTPSVTRMVTRFYRQAAKPLRLFSIANFWRNEKPQRGRNREFWQLNSDIFGSESVNADLEIVQLSLELMLAFQPPQGAFTLHLNHRQLIDTMLSDIAAVPDALHLATVRWLDKFEKLRLDTFERGLTDLGLGRETVSRLVKFMQTPGAEQLVGHFSELKTNPGYRQILSALTTLKELGYGDWIIFKPSLIRGFDYYDGMVFEVFDNHPDNNRAMFGGGRYNGLASLFGSQDIPAVGIAPGDETTRLFLQSWGLVPEHLTQTQSLYLPLLDAQLTQATNRLAGDLRGAAFNVEQGLETQTMRQALSYANKKGFRYVLLLGPDEASQGLVSLKNMQTGEQVSLTKTALIEHLKQMA
jgi:histidyl-tRNA synthetase